MIQIILPYYLTFINFTYNNTENLVSLDNIHKKIRKQHPDYIILTPLIINNNLIIPIIIFYKFKFSSLSNDRQILFKQQINYINSYLLTYTNDINIDFTNNYFLQINFNYYVYNINSTFYQNYLYFINNWIIQYDEFNNYENNYNQIFTPPIITNLLNIPIPLFKNNKNINPKNIPIPLFNNKLN